MKNWEDRVDADALDYVLVVMPEKEIMEKIQTEKKDFEKEFGHALRQTLKPFITVTRFSAREEMEPTLIRWLQKIIGQEKSFSITLNNYSAVPPHTICLRVQDHSTFYYLVKKLEVLNEFIPTGSGFIRRPYLELADKLPEAVYEKAIPEYSRKTFHECFPVNELMLMKRKSSFDEYKTIQVFGLLPQNDLFNRVA
jgi:hypothetical protein